MSTVNNVINNGRMKGPRTGVAVPLSLPDIDEDGMEDPSAFFNSAFTPEPSTTGGNATSDENTSSSKNNNVNDISYRRKKTIRFSIDTKEGEEKASYDITYGGGGGGNKKNHGTSKIKPGRTSIDTMDLSSVSTAPPSPSSVPNADVDETTSIASGTNKLDDDDDNLSKSVNNDDDDDHVNVDNSDEILMGQKLVSNIHSPEAVVPINDDETKNNDAFDNIQMIESFSNDEFDNDDDDLIPPPPPPSPPPPPPTPLANNEEVTTVKIHTTPSSSSMMMNSSATRKEPPMDRSTPHSTSSNTSSILRKSTRLQQTPESNKKINYDLDGFDNDIDDDSGDDDEGDVGYEMAVNQDDKDSSFAKVNHKNTIVSPTIQKKLLSTSSEKHQKKKVIPASDEEDDAEIDESSDDDHDDNRSKYSKKKKKTTSSRNSTSSQSNHLSRKDSKKKSEKKRKMISSDDDDEEFEQKGKSKHKGKNASKSANNRFVTKFTSQGIPQQRTFTVIPVSTLKSESTPDKNTDSNLRRSKRMRLKPLDFWRGEYVEYGPNDFGDEYDGVKNMSVPVNICRADPTPYKPRIIPRSKKEETKKNNNNPNASSSTSSSPSGKKSKPPPPTAIVEVRPFDPKTLRTKYTIHNDNVAHLWDQSSANSKDMVVIARSDQFKFNDLPFAKTRKSSDSKVVGKAAQAFYVTYRNNPMYPGYIMGKLLLPINGVKDAESVGSCAQTFSILAGQPNSLELTYADPNTNNGIMNSKTAQRYLLSPGDVFRIPPGNCYQLQNHSKTNECMMTWTIIRPTQPPHQQS